MQRCSAILREGVGKLKRIELYIGVSVGESFD